MNADGDGGRYRLGRQERRSSRPRPEWQRHRRRRRRNIVRRRSARRATPALEGLRRLRQQSRRHLSTPTTTSSAISASGSDLNGNGLTEGGELLPRSADAGIASIGLGRPCQQPDLEARPEHRPQHRRHSTRTDGGTGSIGNVAFAYKPSAAAGPAGPGPGERPAGSQRPTPARRSRWLDRAGAMGPAERERRSTTVHAGPPHGRAAARARSAAIAALPP